MAESKFYDLLTKTGNVSININNIASIESLNFGTRIILNVTDKNGTNISYETNRAYAHVASEITQKDLNQN